MKAYPRSDVNAVAVPTTGHTHVRPFIPGTETFSPTFCVDDECAEFLVKWCDWASNPAKIELTRDELDTIESEKDMGNALVRQMAAAMATAAATAAHEAGTITATPASAR